MADPGPSDDPVLLLVGVVNLVLHDITDADVEHLDTLKQFALLFLNGTDLTQVDLGDLKGAANRARMNRQRVTVEDSVAEIEKLGGYVGSKYEGLRLRTWLETLFDGPGDADDPVRILTVSGVSLGGKKVTDAELEHLKGLTTLTYLNLRDTAVTDAGLEHLKGRQDQKSHARLYDHRIRLEKEYERYCDLWDKLFALNRAVSQLVEMLGSTNVVRDDEKDVLKFYNYFQEAVRKGEPFMSKSVYDPARDIVRIVGDIFDRVGKQEDLNERRAEKLDPQSDERIADELIRLGKENTAAFKDVERLFQDVSQAISDRVMP